MTQLLKWQEEVQIVKGYNRSTICDLPRYDYIFAPKDIDDFISDIDGVLNENEISNLSEEKRKWLDLFLQKEFFIFIPKITVSSFPSLNLKWNHPSKIVNAILDEEIIDISLPLVDSLICKQLTIICQNYNTVETILAQHFTQTNFQQVNFIVKNDIPENWHIIRDKFIILGTIDSTNSTSTTNLKLIVDINLFSESQEFNTYFNRKIYINKKGQIKNEIETFSIIGNIHDIGSSSELSSLLELNKNTILWNTPKKVIDVCKDCELRHICIDKRIPSQREDGSWYHNVECNYNPYISKWSNEDGYKTLAECGVISSEKEFSIVHEKIATINKELWGE